MRLKELRKHAGKTQLEVANALGISRQAYSNYESEAREPDYETLLRIADYFEVSTDYILERTKEKISSPLSDPLSEEDAALLEAFHAASSETRNNIYLILRLPELLKIPESDPAFSLIEEFKELEKKKPSSV